MLVMTLAREGSLAKASQALGLPRSTLTRRLEQLEQHMGVRLIERNQRYLRLTAAGQLLVERGTSVVDAARQLEVAVRAASMVRLRVAMPPDFGVDVLEPVFRMNGEADDLGFELIYTDREVHPIRDDFDMVVSLSPPTDGNLYCRVVRRLTWRCIATQRYLDERGTPQRVEELGAHPCVALRVHGGLSPFAWPLRAGGDSRVNPRIISTSLSAAQQIVLADRGIALLPDLPSRYDARFVPVLPEQIGAEGVLCVVMGQRLSESEHGRRVRVMLDKAQSSFDQLAEGVEQRASGSSPSDPPGPSDPLGSADPPDPADPADPAEHAGEGSPPG